jgi:hypothetical protein
MRRPCCDDVVLPCLFVRYGDSNVETRSDPITFGFAGPTIGNLVNTIQSDLSSLLCPVYDPFEHRYIDASDGNEVFVLSLRGFNFGPPRADGRGPLATFGSGSSRVRSSVSVHTTLLSASGTVNYTVDCFEEWNHDVIRFVVPYQGSVFVEITSVAVDGTVSTQQSNVMLFQYNSPSLRSNSKDSTLPVVSGDGTGVVQIVGRYLFDTNPTVATRVTIGGTSAGYPIPDADVVRGNLTAAQGGRRLGIFDPDQFLNVTIPPWQGNRVPLVVFRLLASGSTSGSDPYYISIAPPAAVAATGSAGTSTNFSVPVLARTDGSSRVRISGTNVGRIGTRIVFLNANMGTFVNCSRELGYVECTAPAGVGAVDGNLAPLRIALVQPGVMCDPVEQSSSTLTWDTCTLVSDESQLVTTPQQGWLFAYEPPVVVSVTGLLPTTGGLVTVLGYNFGTDGGDVVAWLEPRSSLYIRRIDAAVLTTNITTDPVTGLQELVLEVGPGLGVNWTVTLTVKDQLVNMTTAAQRAALQVSFETPTVTHMSLSTGMTSGGYNVTLLGINFGTADLFAAIGGYVCVVWWMC